MQQALGASGPRREGGPRGSAGSAAPPPPPSATAKIDRSAIGPVGFVAPPRTIADITAILDQEKPDHDRIARLQADADARPPRNASKSELAQFYYDRGAARGLLARSDDALADALKALEVGGTGIPRQQRRRILQLTAIQHKAVGDFTSALKIARQMHDEARRGSEIGTGRMLAGLLMAQGRHDEAEALAQKVEALVRTARSSPRPRWRSAYRERKNSWEADAAHLIGDVLENKGKLAEAQAAFERAEAFRRASLGETEDKEFPPPPEQILHAADNLRLSIAWLKARQGHLVEAEADARRTLLAALGRNGKYHPLTTRFVVGLAKILMEQGRYAEAERLIRSAIDIQLALGVSETSGITAGILLNLGRVLVVQRRFDEAERTFQMLEQAVSAWPASRKDKYLFTDARVETLYAVGKLEQGLAVAERMLTIERAQRGDRHGSTAWSRATLATGYALAGRHAEALALFRRSVPLLVGKLNASETDDDPTVFAARRQKVGMFVESFIAAVTANEQSPKPDEIGETFALADAVRARSVQQALMAATARLSAGDDGLAEMLRKEQDLAKQVSAQLGTLTNYLALAPSERDAEVGRTIEATLTVLRRDHDETRKRMFKQFPAVGALVSPTPPGLREIEKVLRPGEALASYFIGETRAFAWLVTAGGRPRFASLDITAADLEAKVLRLREALEPQIATLEELPPFDVELAHDLYRRLLGPIADGLDGITSLIVTGNGALGSLPFSVLVTQKTAPPSSPGATPFEEYRSIAWLARKLAVSVVPSAASLISLRTLPPGPGGRKALVGFGDPYFNKAQQLEGPLVETAAIATRGHPIRFRAAVSTDSESVGLGDLPRLPDTADELTSIALALQADPTTSLFLGERANEVTVKETNLDRYRIVAFATHGLIPGDLSGLSQPALALSAPDVADVDGDGLLTMGEILEIRLNADWVVLSACNTGSAAGTGAEAASGLARAFFYAGARALLITNWSVHSASARELVSDIFRNQAATHTLSRAEALQQSMLRLISNGGWREPSGALMFSYAHPIFWAPYSIIGDGGL